MARPSQQRPRVFVRSVFAVASVVVAMSVTAISTAQSPDRADPVATNAANASEPNTAEQNAVERGVVVSGAVDAPTSSGNPDPLQTSACIDAHIEGQEARLEGRLLEARAALTSCASADCPRLLREDCVRLSQLVMSEIPRLVLRPPAGLDPAKLRTSIDGVHLEATSYDSPLPLNPGTHRLLVEAEGYLPLRTTFTLTTGAPPVTLHVMLTPSPNTVRAGDAQKQGARTTTGASPAAAPARRSEVPTFGRVPALSYVFGGAALLAAGLATHFALTGVDERRRLQRTCAPLCSKRDVGAVDGQLLLADVSAGVSLVSLAVAALSYFAEPPAETDGALADTTLELGSTPLALRLGGRF